MEEEMKEVKEQLKTLYEKDKTLTKQEKDDIKRFLNLLEMIYKDEKSLNSNMKEVEDKKNKHLCSMIYELSKIFLKR